LSEGQVRERLDLRGYTAAAISSAVRRLKDERTLDDVRAARAVARTEANVRRHGPQRVMSKLIAMRIERDLAREIVREVFGDTDEDTLLERALDRKLRGRTDKLSDPGERQKLVAYLVRQGFGASSASKAVRARVRRESQ
jgi:SOS response regulatory protein OraA/RecX